MSINIHFNTALDIFIEIRTFILWYLVRINIYDIISNLRIIILTTNIVFIVFGYGFYGFLLFLNGELRLPDIFQYFLKHFWNFQNVDQIWTPRPLVYYHNTSTNTRNSQIILKCIIFISQHFGNPQFSNNRKCGPPFSKQHFLKFRNILFTNIFSGTWDDFWEYLIPIIYNRIFH